MRTLRRLAAQESELPRVRVVYETASGPAVPPLDPGHAERGGTAFIMSILPQSIDLAALPPDETPLRYRDYGIVNGAAFDGHPTPNFAVPRESDPRHATRQE